jgi:hypothetical protein
MQYVVEPATFDYRSTSFNKGMRYRTCEYCHGPGKKECYICDGFGQLDA